MLTSEYLTICTQHMPKDLRKLGFYIGPRASYGVGVYLLVVLLKAGVCVLRYLLLFTVKIMKFFGVHCQLSFLRWAWYCL